MLFLSGKKGEGESEKKEKYLLCLTSFVWEKNTEVSKAAKIRPHSIKDS